MPSRVCVADDRIFQDMVQRMADMHVAIRIRRAIMQDELFAPAAAVAQLFIQALFLPTGKDHRFLLRKASLHGEIGLRQEDGIAIVYRFSHVESALSAKQR